ncbi:protein NLRC3-like [Dysidea avara]|uniref:protein NLRC3-like n=1 Tax=Dysidea avara TaxID=196820 RepID=UPI0033273FB7
MAHQSVTNGLEQFKTSDKATSTPLLKDLQSHITPHYAAHWRVIGTQLGLPKGRLDIIEQDNVYRSVPCCNDMWSKWLKMDPSASWKKLFKAIESPAVSSDQAPDKVTSKPNMDKSTQGVSVLSERVSQITIQTRFAVEEDAWPPKQPKQFTPLLLVHHQGEHNIKLSTALAKLQSGGIDHLTSTDSVPKCHQLDSSHESLREVLDVSKMTKQLVDILAPLDDSNDPQLILVEGLPGIGKSILLQEISYKWSTKQLLQKFKLLLLVQLRNPAVQQAKLINDLLSLFCRGDGKAVEISTACSQYFFSNGGRDLALLFDGFDEFPDNLQKDSLVADILKRQVLPHCGLVVSSRPHASVKLREVATVRVDILGFAEEERKLYIEQSLKGHPQKIKELTDYLDSHLTINGLCYVPFIMVALLYLYDQGIPLPNSSVELYHRFICLTICRHLAKSGHPLENDATDLADLPEPCNTIVKQLAKLSLKALNDNKLIFTLEEVKATCPDITAIPGAINGFGLLQAVQHFGVTAKTMTFNFSHFSIQEFLAAYHVAQLPTREELIVLREKFWNDIHANMFSIYTTLTKGQRPAFKQFLRQEQPSILQSFKRFFSGSRDEAAIVVSHKFLEEQIKCLRLFRCFKEAGDEEICRSITNSKCFHNKVINLSSTSLSPYDIECVTLFLTCSPHKEWKKLNLWDCHIQDIGLRIIYRDLMSHNVTIKILDLGYNGFTRSSSSFISDLIIHCRVEELNIIGNHTIGEDPALYNMLTHPSSRLVTLDMHSTSLSSPSAITLFTAISKGNKLKVLYIWDNLITDEACDVIATTMKNNTSLVRLGMSPNKISGEAAQRLLQALYNNDTLEWLFLPFGYTEDDRKRIRSLHEVIIKNRESRGCQTKLIINW